MEDRGISELQGTWESWDAILISQVQDRGLKRLWLVQITRQGSVSWSSMLMLPSDLFVSVPAALGETRRNTQRSAMC